MKTDQIIPIAAAFAAGTVYYYYGNPRAGPV